MSDAARSQYVDGLVDAVENPVEGFEAAIVFSTVDVLVVELDHVFLELRDSVPGDAGLASARRPTEKRRSRATITSVARTERI